MTGVLLPLAVPTLAAETNLYTNLRQAHHMRKLLGTMISVSNFDDYCVAILTSIVTKIDIFPCI